MLALLLLLAAQPRPDDLAKGEVAVLRRTQRESVVLVRYSFVFTEEDPEGRAARIEHDYPDEARRIRQPPVLFTTPMPADAEAELELQKVEYFDGCRGQLAHASRRQVKSLAIKTHVANECVAFENLAVPCPAETKTNTQRTAEERIERAIEQLEAAYPLGAFLRIQVRNKGEGSKTDAAMWISNSEISPAGAETAYSFSVNAMKIVFGPVQPYETIVVWLSLGGMDSLEHHFAVALGATPTIGHLSTARTRRPATTLRSGDGEVSRIYQRCDQPRDGAD